jgi:hypothetical protein
VRSDYDLLKVRYKAKILVPMPKVDELGAPADRPSTVDKKTALGRFFYRPGIGHM